MIEQIEKEAKDRENLEKLKTALKRLGINATVQGYMLVAPGVKIDPYKKGGLVVFVSDQPEMIRPGDYGYTVRIQNLTSVRFEPFEIIPQT